jgi:hypothetical protein
VPQPVSRALQGLTAFSVWARCWWLCDCAKRKARTTWSRAGLAAPLLVHHGLCTPPRMCAVSRRSAAIVAAYLISVHGGRSASDTVAYIRVKYPYAQPNSGFMAQVRRAARLGGLAHHAPGRPQRELHAALCTISLRWRGWRGWPVGPEQVLWAVLLACLGLCGGGGGGV